MRGRSRGRWVRGPSVLWRYVPGGILLLAPGADDPVLLSGSGAAVWQLLAEPLQEEDVIETLARACAVEATVVAADLRPLLDEMAARELVVPVR